MYAVIKTGGKQYRVSEGDILRFEKLAGEEGDAVTFNEVLMIADGEKFTVGAPLVAGATVAGEVVEQGRGKKVYIVKFRRRKHHRKQMGHRQSFTAVKIGKISAK